VNLRIVFTPNAWQDYDGWLRRDLKIYRVRGNDLEIAACYGHYLDK